MRAWKSQRWGLPHAGGWFDQPLRLFVEMEAALNVYEAFKARRDAEKRGVGAVEFSRKHKEVVNLIASVEKLRDKPI